MSKLFEMEFKLFSNLTKMWNRYSTDNKSNLYYVYSFFCSLRSFRLSFDVLSIGVLTYRDFYLLSVTFPSNPLLGMTFLAVSSLISFLMVLSKNYEDSSFFSDIVTGEENNIVVRLCSFIGFDVSKNLNNSNLIQNSIFYILCLFGFLQSFKHYWRQLGNVKRLVKFVFLPLSEGSVFFIWRLMLLVESASLYVLFYERAIVIKSLLASKVADKHSTKKKKSMFSGMISSFGVLGSLGRIGFISQKTTAWIAKDELFPKSSLVLFLPALIILDLVVQSSIWFSGRIKNLMPNFQKGPVKYENKGLLALFFMLFMQSVYSFYKGFCDIKELLFLNSDIPEYRLMQVGVFNGALMVLVKVNDILFRFFKLFPKCNTSDQAAGSVDSLAIPSTSVGVGLVDKAVSEESVNGNMTSQEIKVATLV